MPAVADTLYPTLAETLQADDRLQAYLLIDPMLWEPFDADTLDTAGCPVTPIPIKRPVLAADQRPRLIQWRPSATHVLYDSLHIALDAQNNPAQEARGGFAIGGWLLSVQPAAALAQHLARVMHLLRPGVGRRYVRWADRRVLEWFWPVLSADQKRRLLGPIEAWWTLNRRDETIVYQPPEATDSRNKPMQLTPAQWQRADDCELMQTLLREWRGFQPQLPADYLRRAREAMGGARSLALRTETDILLLSLCALQVHPQLHTHPWIREAVASADNGQRTLEDALATIPDPEGWEQIRAELDDPPTQAAVTQTVNHA